jgi:hypothetical protein
MVRLVILIALCACTRTSEKYCGLHPEDLANCAPSDGSIDARPLCTGDPDCHDPAPRCFLPGAGPGMCVGCLTSADCKMAGKAACDPETLSCRSCVEHADCLGSQACLPDGTCGTDDNVIYVAAGGADTGACTFAAKCATITYALTKVTTARYHLKLSGTLNESIAIVSKRVVLLSEPNTKLVGKADPVVLIQKSTATIVDLEIECGTTPAMGGVKSEMASSTYLRSVFLHGCGKKGVEQKGGFINITRSRFAQNLDGAVSTDGTTIFQITNSLFYRNGDVAAPHGAVTIGATTTGMLSRFEHNTIADNVAKSAATVAGGLSCTLTNFLEMPNNIIAGNTTSTGLNNNVFGGCDVSKSLVTEDPVPLDFADRSPPYDYHITLGSSAIDKVDMSSQAEDVDGQFRPQGPKKDFGADEFKP